jgi:cysteine desulfurase/selenocysteine lyase
MISEDNSSAEALSAQFPVLSQKVHGKRLVYLDSASTTQKPQAVIDCMTDYYMRYNANVHRGIHQLSQIASEAFEKTRFILAGHINSTPDELVFTRGCTEALNLIARSFGGSILKEGDEIVISEMEHHANIVPWYLIAQEKGAKIVPAPVTGDAILDIEALANLLTDKVKIVAVTHASNATGNINPIKEIVQLCRRVGAYVVVDGAQGGAHLEVDVSDLDVDFYTLSCHKMYAPTGVGALFGKRNLLQKMPPYQGGGHMIETVAFDRITFRDPPIRFEPGTPSIAEVIGLGKALEFLQSLDRDSIQRHERNLSDLAEAELSEIKGVKIFGKSPHKIGLTSFTINDVHPHDIGSILDSEGVAVRTGHHCCMPLMKKMGVPATVRASFGVYNTEKDVRDLVKAVHKVRELF